jgi:hypothetical protein
MVPPPVELAHLHVTTTTSTTSTHATPKRNITRTS